MQISIAVDSTLYCVQTRELQISLRCVHTSYIASACLCGVLHAIPAVQYAMSEYSQAKLQNHPVLCLLLIAARPVGGFSSFNKLNSELNSNKKLLFISGFQRAGIPETY